MSGGHRPGQGLASQSARPFMTSSYQSVPVFAWTWPAAGLSCLAAADSVPSIPNTGRPASSEGQSGRLANARSNDTAAEGVVASARSPPAPPANDADPIHAQFAGNVRCRRNPAASVRSPFLAATSNGIVLAYKLWLIFSVTFTTSENGGDSNLATRTSLP